MEDYKEKYEMALEGIQEILSSGQDSIKMPQLQLRLQGIFPELRGDEDEKIRKALVRFHKSTIDIDGIKGADILAWLEKQGDNNNQNWKPSKEQINALEHFVRSIGESGYTSPYDDNTNLLNSLINDLYKLEKQGEQKPTVLDFKASNFYVSKVDGKIHDITYNSTDKLEPKFKVGDFIVNDYCMGRVIEITNDAYLLDTEQGIPFSCEHNVHLWTIADAKEGNILAGKIDGDNYILIFKTIKDGWIETYGHYYNAVNRFCVPSQLFCRSYQGTFTPATEEQRDTLIKAMTDAGYQWDAEKKELKLLITNGGDFEQKQEWSEEDMSKVQRICKYLDEAKKYYADITEVRECVNWLKSLEDRVWHNSWKPSKEQMDALLGIMIESGFDYIDYNTLESLYNDLKKL